MKKSEKLLYDILVRNAPSAHWIRGLIASHFIDNRLLDSLPDPSGSKPSYGFAVVEAITRHGLLDGDFVSYLAQALPHEQSPLNEIRRLLSVPMHVETIVSFDGLMDNWVYQDITELYADGPRDSLVGFVSVGEDELTWNTGCWSGVALESLLAVLSGIVLRDRFFVEEKYINAWIGDQSPVLGLHAGGILRPFPEPDELWKVRSPLYKELLHTPALQRLHRRNMMALRETGKSAHEYETMVVWGSIGYLARSAVLGVTYIGHPARRGFLAQTPFSDMRQDAAVLTIGKLDEARARRFTAIEETTSITLGMVVPALLVNIIQEARNCEDLVIVALQYREKYSALRRWLAYFQKALYDRDAERIMEYHAAIQSVISCLENHQAHGSLRHDIASRTILSLPGLHRPAAVILERLARTPPGEAAIDRLLDLFEISGSLLETPVLTHLRKAVLQPE